MAGMEIAALHARVSADVSDFSRGMDKVKSDMATTEKGMGGMASLLGGGLKIAAGVGVAAVGALAAGIGAATVKAMEFEQGIADIGAMMNLTSEETATLEDHIMDLGLDPNLKVSADEAAGAVMALGTAGLDLPKIMEGASKATVLLANATGLKGKEGFASAATIATDVMAQFGIEAKDMKKAVSQIAGTTVASKFSIQDYQLALAQAGGVASSVGVSFEDFNAVIAATSPSFASGSDAGTSFKTFLQTLVPKSKEASEVMYELGILTTDWADAASFLSGILGTEVEPNVTAVYEAFLQTEFGAKAAAKGQKALATAFEDMRVQFDENAFFDENTGAMKDMDEIAGVLQTAFADLSEEQRIEAASTLFGTDAMRTAFALVETGTDGINEMSKAIEDVNAEELASKRMDTLSGSWEIFQGVIETLTLQIGNAFLPAARDLTTWATNLAQTYGPAVVKWAGDFSAALSIVTTEVGKVMGENAQTVDKTFGTWPEATRRHGAATELETKTWLSKVAAETRFWTELFSGDWDGAWDAMHAYAEFTQQDSMVRTIVWLGDMLKNIEAWRTEHEGKWGEVFANLSKIMGQWFADTAEDWGAAGSAWVSNLWSGIVKYWNEVVVPGWNALVPSWMEGHTLEVAPTVVPQNLGVVNPGNLSREGQMDYLFQNWGKYETPYTSPMPSINNVNITVPAASDPYQQGVLIGNGIGDELRKRGYQ